MLVSPSTAASGGIGSEERVKWIEVERRGKSGVAVALDRDLSSLERVPSLFYCIESYLLFVVVEIVPLNQFRLTGLLSIRWFCLQLLLDLYVEWIAHTLHLCYLELGY
jgi:hypothetical protein